MALENDTLDNQTADSNITKDAVSDNSLYMSPQEAAMFDAHYNSMYGGNNNSGAGNLNQNDYYPHYVPGGGGISSGSIIGNQTLFGGGAALVPMGMYDARDVAIKKAALQKAKEVEDFRKGQKIPVSKLTNINDHLTNEYIDYQHKSWDKALNLNGGDPHKATVWLKNNPEYQQKNQSYQNMKLLGDDLANHMAQDQLDERSGNFTPTPSYKTLRDKVLTIADPTHPDFKNFGNSFRKLKMEKNFAKSLDEVMKTDFATEHGVPGIDTSNPEFIKIYNTHTKEITPEQQQHYADILSQNHFAGSDYHTPEKNLADVKALTSGKVVNKTMTIQQKREDNNTDYDYTGAQPLTQTETNVNEGGKVSPVFGENAYKTTAKHEAMTLNIPISEDMVDTKGKKINSQSGYVKGNVSGIQNGYFDKLNKRFLNKSEVAELLSSPGPKNHNIEVKPVAVLNVDPVKSQDGKISSQNTVLVDASEIKGKFKNPKKGKDQKDFDDLIQENQDKASEANKVLHQKNQVQQPVKKTIKQSDISLKAKAAGYSEKEYTKLLRDKGIEITK